MPSWLTVILYPHYYGMRRTGCLALASDEVAAALEKALAEQNVEAKVELKTTGCPGFCEQGPIVVVHPQRIFYTRVTQRC
jgi:NADH-quinone oxidoreductase subunit F